MNRKTNIIVSVVGITIVTLALLGITYAYYLTRIEGNTNTNSISITTADLVLKYADRTENIDFNGVQPGFIKTKEFTVTNEGNNKVTDYRVYLENVVNNLERNTDLVYTLTCTSNDTVNSPCTNQVTEETTFPGINTTLVLNTLDVGDTHTYTLTVHYKEMNVDQSIDMNKNISAKINIYDKNSLNELTMSHYILSNGALVDRYELVKDLIPSCVEQMGEKFCEEEGIYGDFPRVVETLLKKEYLEKTTITKKADGADINEVGIFTAPDDYGTSYYYRGTVKNNYVKFAGFMWKIVRINGDGSIRLILDGTLDKIKHEEENDFVYKKPALYALNTTGRPKFNSTYDDNAYLGYMYGEFSGNSISYEQAIQNKKSSTIKTYFETFYQEYLLDYQDDIADTLFCGDKTLATDNDYGYGMFETNYSANTRISLNTTKTPTFECAKGASNNYSRYTSKHDMSTKTFKGVEINNDLTYPIGLLTADELLMSGAFPNFVGEENHYYLNGIAGCTMTPQANLMGLYAILYTEGGNGFLDALPIEHAGSSAPVINLKADSVVIGGDGTIDAPYRLKERNN